MRGLIPGCPGRQNTCFTGVRSHVPGPLQAQLNANKGACRVGLTKPLVCIFRLGSHSIFLSHLGCRHNGRPNALLARRSPGTRPPCCAVHSSVGSPFIHPSIHPSIHPCIHVSMYPSNPVAILLPNLSIRELSNLGMFSFDFFFCVRVCVRVFYFFTSS